MDRLCSTVFYFTWIGNKGQKNATIDIKDNQYFCCNPQSKQSLLFNKLKAAEVHLLLQNRMGTLNLHLKKPSCLLFLKPKFFNNSPYFHRTAVKTWASPEKHCCCFSYLSTNFYFTKFLFTKCLIELKCKELLTDGCGENIFDSCYSIKAMFMFVQRNKIHLYLGKRYVLMLFKPTLWLHLFSW